jgi:hypothetical protein
MTDIENRLRDELRAEAQRAQPHMLRELRVPRRRRAAWAKSWMAPIAAVIAVAAVIAGTQFAVRDLHAGPAAAAPARMPPFYVITQDTGHAGVPAVVRRSANGSVVARVSAPAGKIFGWVAAASDGRTFVLSANQGAAVSFYRLRLAADGKPRPLTALPFTLHQATAGEKAGYVMTGMGLSPGGMELAVALQSASVIQSARPAGTARAAIEVAPLSTGRWHVWTAPAKVGIGDLSWENGGRKLAYLSSSLPSQGPLIVQMSVLDTARTGSDLAASSARVTLRTATPVLAAVITPDGRNVIAWGGLSPGSSAVVLGEFSARTGQRLRVLYRGPGHGNFITYGFLTISADPSGRHLLIMGMPLEGSTLLLGRVDNGRFTRLPGVNPSVQMAFTAW